MKDRFRIGKIHISVTYPVDADKKITEAAISKSGGYICVSNLRMVKYAGSHPEYANLMEHSFMNLPDGTPLTWLGKLWGLKGIAVTNGPATFQRLLKNGNKDLKHYLLGDTQEVVDAILEKYTKEYNANFGGGSTLPFADVKDFDYEGIAKQVRESGANVVWTAMRAPKQDEFNERLSKLLPGVVLLGVGRAFRISIGDVKMAKGWAQKMGITGLFTRKVSLGTALWWYFKSTFSLLGYAMDITYRRIIGKNYYE